MRQLSIVALPGDGIGEEVVGSALQVLEAAGELHGIALNVEKVDGGAARYRREGKVCTEADFNLCRSADAILLGALGLPDVLLPDGTEAGPDLQFRLRFELELFAGVRPVRLWPGIPSPLRDPAGLDLTIIRENTEGLYASRGGGAVVAGRAATDTLVMTAEGVDRVCRYAFEYALSHPRDGEMPNVTSVDKSNVLRSYAFWRRRFDSIAAEYAGRVEARHVYVDAFTALLVLQPGAVHVAVAENMFGDIISDLSGALVGSLGLAPSADVGSRHAVFQPAHGSAPTIAGKGVANPAATILSAAMLAEWVGEDGLARDIEQAIAATLAAPSGRTRDVGGRAATQSVTELVIQALEGPDPGKPATLG